VSRSASAVLDASALIALLNQEPGSERVAEVIGAGAAVGAVNLSEVVAKLADLGMSEDAIRQALGPLDLDVVEFDTDLAYAAGLLRPATRNLGLGLGDRACLACGLLRSLPVLTADRAWTTIPLPVSVELIR
jgi:PIN domain nuclease of toxin-antitoxin system